MRVRLLLTYFLLAFAITWSAAGTAILAPAWFSRTFGQLDASNPVFFVAVYAPTVPIIFASGDDRLAADLAGMDWLEYVTVKKATAADSAESRPVAETRAELTAKAQKAVENLRAGLTKSMRVSMPLVAGLKAVPPASLAMLEGIPGVAYADSVLSFPADSIKHAYDVLEKLVGAATGGYMSVLRRGLRSNPAAPAIMAKFRTDLQQAWFDQESGRRQPAPPAPAGPRKYHGYQ